MAATLAYSIGNTAAAREHPGAGWSARHIPRTRRVGRYRGRVNRQCARPTCSSSAAVTLSYDYAASAVWLDALHLDAHPMTHDLCPRHADGLSVPRGWVLHDQRAVARAS